MAKVKETKLDAFRPQEANHNTHSQRGMGALEASMRKHGYVAPMTAAADGEIIDGSARLETVANVFGDDVMVVEHDGKRPIVMVRTDIPNATTNEARAISIAANRIAEINLTWDAAELLADMQSGIDMSHLFRQDELDALLAGMVEAEPVQDVEPDISKADALQEVWQIKLGDIWQLGKHRLACGDCTDKATVERLMDGEKASLMVTDPPYGVDYGELVRSRKNQKQGGWTDIENDGLTDDELSKLLKESLHGAGALVGFVWHPPGARRWLFWEALEFNGWRIAQEIVWVKNALVFGRADYQWRHEPCMYVKKEGAPRQDDRTQTTVWEINKPTDSMHPTQKPTELYCIPIRNHTVQGDIVYEPFSGSGTCIMACEMEERQCRAIELVPGYVAVALERWSLATNTPPVRLTSAAT